eukprot:CAMPEP_0119158762 /NCGR_PEP_ID=MMETSP1310-20130426/53423_1 /TAXON_ID=464262 /ORGANISM="Genus nov. species nov., Strain RCC2339" /LENGTH=330 /DNA_ID=CAMNT_0007151387 /DNA_START=80 /DNA_END=1073 /DNA_ORIENTATION=-
MCGGGLSAQGEAGAGEGTALSHMREGSIICLQEVSRSWLGSLLPVFREEKYVCVHSLYGPSFNDYMGVAILVADHLDVRRVDVVRLSDWARWPRVDTPPPSWGETALRWVGLGGARPENLVARARRRYNTLIRVEVGEKEGSSLVVATYHMPCDFRNELVMHLHSSAAVRAVQEWANGTPWVLAGDFNLRPGSSSYRLLTTGSLGAVEEAAFLDSNPGLKADHLRVPQPARSAYADVTSAEPAFTNHSYSERPGQPGNEFTGTLDYIFYAPPLVPTAVLPLPVSTADLGGYLPSIDEPSDHLLLGADFEVPALEPAMEEQGKKEEEKEEK